MMRARWPSIPSTELAYALACPAVALAVLVVALLPGRVLMVAADPRTPETVAAARPQDLLDRPPDVAPDADVGEEPPSPPPGTPTAPEPSTSPEPIDDPAVDGRPDDTSPGTGAPSDEASPTPSPGSPDGPRGAPSTPASPLPPPRPSGATALGPGSTAPPSALGGTAPPAPGPGTPPPIPGADGTAPTPGPGPDGTAPTPGPGPDGTAPPEPLPSSPPSEEPVSAPTANQFFVNGREFLPGQAQMVPESMAALTLRSTISGDGPEDEFFVITTPPSGPKRYVQGRVPAGTFTLAISLGENGQYFDTAERVDVYAASGQAAQDIAARQAPPGRRRPFDTAAWAGLDPPPRLIGGILVQRVPPP